MSKYLFTKTFKVLDFWISVSLIIGSVVFAITAEGEKFLLGYFVVGGWQVISMGVHWAKKWFVKESRQRRYYHRVVMGLIIFAAIVTGLGTIDDAFYLPLLIILWPLLFIAPLMAVFYACICYNETFIKMKRPLKLFR